MFTWYSIKGGMTHVYQGDRKTEDIVQYTRRMAGPAIKDLKGACSTLPCAFEESENFFGFVGKQEGPLWVTQIPFSLYNKQSWNFHLP